MGFSPGPKPQCSRRIELATSGTAATARLSVRFCRPSRSDRSADSSRHSCRCRPPTSSGCATDHRNPASDPSERTHGATTSKTTRPRGSRWVIRSSSACTCSPVRRGSSPSARTRAGRSRGISSHQLSSRAGAPIARAASCGAQCCRRSPTTSGRSRSTHSAPAGGSTRCTRLSSPAARFSTRPPGCSARNAAASSSTLRARAATSGASARFSASRHPDRCSPASTPLACWSPSTGFRDRASRANRCSEAIAARCVRVSRADSF